MRENALHYNYNHNGYLENVVDSKEAKFFF